MGSADAADGVADVGGPHGSSRPPSLLDLAPVGIFEADAAGRCLFVNRRWSELAGLDRERALGDGWVRAIHPEDRDRVGRAWSDAAAGGREFLAEYRFRTPEGRVTWVQGRATAVHDGDGRVAGFVGTLTDITDRRRAEDELHATRAQLQYVTDTMPAFVARCGRDRRFVWVNRRYAERFGMAAEALAGRPIREVLGEEAYRAIEPYIERALAGETVDYEVELAYRGLPPRWMRASYVPTLDPAGVPDGWVAVVTDVTARKATEESLRQSERRFAGFMQHLPGLAWIKDLAGRYVYVNDAAAAAFRAPREAILGRTDEEVFPPATAAQFRENDRRALAAGSGIQAVETLEHDDGVEHSSLVSKFPIPGPDGAPALIGGMAIDITERLRAEAALGESERRFRLALASGAVTVFEQDLDLRYTWVYPQDPAFPEHNLGRTDLELVPDEGGRELFQLKRQVLESGQGARRTVRVALPPGVRYYDLLVQPRYDASGRVAGVGGVALDVTARKRVEESLQEADRRKDEFLATLAHELRNPLAPIANSARLLGLAGELDPESESARAIIERQVQQLTRLVDDLLDVSRVSRGKITLRRRRVDLASVVAQAVETSRPPIQEAGHELTVCLPREPLAVEGDPARLTQAIGNLLNNAARYTDGPGRITIEATREGDRARVAVRDTGVGIPPEMLGRIFELFAQVETGLDRRHGGLGIGLTLVKSLVELHGGTVEARSDGPGRGSEFILRLPMAPATGPFDDHEGQAPGLVRRATRGCRILVVDDNIDSAVTLARLLRRLGHEVAEAFDGPAALEIASRFRPGVMLIDLGMPGMSGLDVARHIREQAELSGMRLVAVTGWGQADDRLRTRRAGFDHHLVKPIRLDTLHALLARWAGTEAADRT